MKTCNASAKTKVGNALLVAVVITAVIGFVLASYLKLVSNQNLSVMRSQAWNATIALVEAGVEEAMAHIHEDGLANLTANGWTAAGATYIKRRDLGEDYVLVSIRGANPPVVEAEGFVRLPLTQASYVSRRIRVTTRRDALFAKAMVAKGRIDLNGNNIATDSFDSTDPSKSTNGRYDPAKRNSVGDVATNSQFLDVGNANLMGHIATGPGGIPSIGVGASVGDVAWVSSGHKGIMPNWASDDMNVAFDSVDEPYSTGDVPRAGTVDGVAYNFILENGRNYILNSTLSGKVLVRGNASLYVKAGVSLAGQDVIQIAPGASLKLYVSGASASLGGNGVVNPNTSALSFQYFGLPSNTSVSFSGNAAFTGVIYAPDADLSLGGGGYTTYDFVGSSVSKTVSMNGHFNFHYDESLGRIGPVRMFVINSWNEMTPTGGYGMGVTTTVAGGDVSTGGGTTVVGPVAY